MDTGLEGILGIQYDNLGIPHTIAEHLSREPMTYKEKIAFLRIKKNERMKQLRPKPRYDSLFTESMKKLDQTE